MHVEHRTLYGAVQVRRTPVFGRRSFLGPHQKNTSYHFWIPLEKSLIPIKKVFRSDVNSGARGVNGIIPGYGWPSLYQLLYQSKERGRTALPGRGSPF